MIDLRTVTQETTFTDSPKFNYLLSLYFNQKKKQQKVIVIGELINKLIKRSNNADGLYCLDYLVDRSIRWVVFNTQLSKPEMEDKRIAFSYNKTTKL